MNQPLDQKEHKTKNKKGQEKLYNSILFGISFAIIILAIYKVWDTKNSLDSPLLPQYTIFHVNGALINYTIIQFFGVLPALYLRIKKHYAISTYCIIAFMILGIIIKSNVSFYEYLYQLV